ncbi:Stk1 family PASTA domain-containing Ser/Thr kinase [Pseudarthrobacter sp. P1]|uniref:Stk1 family PASTA domain-containing Ser/Thr kinase n=1 Tax=Pseudarthrobacter sp. P1 TaxID=3418418 RepID=UPI003CF5D978
MGSTVDSRYLVQSKVARGGMSTVYLATDHRLNRYVALKVLHPHLALDENFVARLQREAQAAAQLSHPHVVSIFDQAYNGQLAYLVMEYVPGNTLRDELNARGALTPREALRYLDAVVEGLGAAHAAGLVHRDVKPENVLLSHDGRIKIGDFGLARAVTTTTNTATLIGTVAYISPELVNGELADARSDIYSVGIMLYELLTGQQPFRGDMPIHVAMQHVRGTVPAPSEVLPGLSADLDELVRCCTEMRPEDRPEDGYALLEDLRHVRATMADTDLDFVPAGARQPAAAGGLHGTATTVLPAHTAPVRTTGHQATEAFAGPAFGQSAGQSATVALGGLANHTTVMPAGNRLYVPGDARPEPEVGDRPDRSRVPRAAKREARAAEKARAKAAARPVKTLGKGNPRRRGLIWLTIVLVLAVLGAGAGWFFGMGPGALATVPEVSNKTVAEAQELLSREGFNASIEDVFDENIAQGLAVTTDPGPATEQRRFQHVTLLVSKGPVLYPVPAVTGGTLEAAKVALTAAKMALGTVTERFDESAAAGTVLAQDPAPATEKRSATPVNLVVSKGPTPIPVPAVVGQPKDAAAKAIADAGLAAVFAPDVFDKTIPAGTVVAQDPANGTLTKGGKVTLTVSKGPKLVTVPSYVGKQVEKAVQELKDLGFDVKVNNILGGFFGTVRDQSPVNKDVPEGSTITLTVV